jgi:uncharacterized membrane protein (DUF373 family)
MVVGAIATLLVFSYLVGDNPLYRFALYLFIGALLGYSFGVIVRDVFFKMVLVQLLSTPLAVVIPLVLGILLLFKGFPKRAYIGNLSVAYLVGVGAAVGLSGALLGTLAPQVGATGRALAPAIRNTYPLGIWDGLLIVVGTISTLMAFNFTAQPAHSLGGIWQRLVRVVGGIGRLFLIVALAVAFAGALTAALSMFIGRIQSVIDAVNGLYLYLGG